MGRLVELSRLTSRGVLGALAERLPTHAVGVASAPGRGCVLTEFPDVTQTLVHVFSCVVGTAVSTCRHTTIVTF